MSLHEFQRDVEEGILSEERMAQRALYFMTNEQKHWLTQRNLTLIDILNGRYSVALASEIDTFMRSVNQTLGFEFFQLGADAVNAMLTSIESELGSNIEFK